MIRSYHEDVKKRIGTDLASFADPGSVDIGDGSRTFSAEWKMRGEPREGRFNVSEDHGITVHINRERQPYRVFLANTQMADLRHIAQMIGQAWPREIFIPTKARRTEYESEPALSATQLLTNLIENDELEVTQILMVTGEAGAGKTQVLQELVLQQADRYLNGETEKLLLYVNAQGRALARLNEALATELQDLRVNLTYHSVATLTRVGLLVPVIDGFDELLGVSGYDDAFNSLAVFLEQLEGQGRLIASARSVYYEEEFLSRADRPSVTGEQAWSHVPIKIEPWDSSDQNGYLDELTRLVPLSDVERTELGDRVHRAFTNNEELASKPLFFAKTVALLQEDAEFSGGDDLLDTLTRRFLEREQNEKLLDRQQRPLLPEHYLDLLMSELAEEMWNQETHELDRGSVREVAEYILEDHRVSEDARQTTVERMPTLAFLAPGEKHASIRFEHEIFFFHFLARAIAKRFAQGMDMRVILSRSPLPEFVGERLAFELKKDNRLLTINDIQQTLDRLAQAGRPEWRRTTQVRENAGLIVLALLRRFANGNGSSIDISNCRIETVVFRGSHLRNVTLRNCTLDDVEIRRTDLGATKFIGCDARDVFLLEPRVKIGSTRMELVGLRVPEDVFGLQELGDATIRKVYSPKEIARILKNCGAIVAMVNDDGMRNVPDEYLSLLERLLRAYERANTICEGDHHLASLFDDPYWGEFRKLLVDHGIVRQENRPTSGRPKVFFRRQFLPEEIMKGETKINRAKPQIVRFWDALESVKI